MLDPTIFELGTVRVTWFGVMLACGFFSAYLAWLYNVRVFGRDRNLPADILLWIMVSGIAGARLVYVMANAAYFSQHPMEIIMINHGGLIYYGGLIGGTAGMYLFALRAKVRFAELIDFVITGVPVAHFFGRVGCFINGCCHGSVHNSLIGVRYPYLSQPWYRQVEEGLITRFVKLSEPVHPVQLYEAFYNLLLFFGVCAAYRKYRGKPGRTSGIYLILYPAGRYLFEFLRGDERQHVLGINTAQFISLSLMIIGFSALFISGSNDKADCKS